MACSDIFSSTVVVISVRVICIRLSLNSVDFELSSLPSIKWESHIQLDKGLFRTKMAFPGKRELFFRVSSATTLGFLGPTVDAFGLKQFSSVSTLSAFRQIAASVLQSAGITILHNCVK
jgi:hypothetical protein